MPASPQPLRFGRDQPTRDHVLCTSFTLMPRVRSSPRRPRRGARDHATSTRRGASDAEGVGRVPRPPDGAYGRSSPWTARPACPPDATMAPRMPAEFEPHERTVICWPARREIYPGCCSQKRKRRCEWRARSRGSSRAMIAQPWDGERAEEMCVAASTSSNFRSTTRVPRHGPIYVSDGDRSRRSRLDVTGWGDKSSRTTPTRQSPRAGGACRTRATRVPMVLEGGSIASTVKERC